MSLAWTIAAVVIAFLAGRVCEARQVVEHDRTFNANLRRLAFRMARSAYPKGKGSQT